MEAKDIILDDSELAVLRALTFSRQPANEIGDKCGLYGRELRQAIASLRHKGFRIIAADSGYWIARDNEEYLAWRRIYADKIMQRLESMFAMDEGADFSVIEQLKAE